MGMLARDGYTDTLTEEIIIQRPTIFDMCISKLDFGNKEHETVGNKKVETFVLLV